MIGYVKKKYQKEKKMKKKKVRIVRCVIINKRCGANKGNVYSYIYSQKLLISLKYIFCSITNYPSCGIDISIFSCQSHSNCYDCDACDASVHQDI